MGKGDLTPRSGASSELEKAAAQQLIANRKASIAQGNSAKQVRAGPSRKARHEERIKLSEQKRVDRQAKADVSKRRKIRRKALEKELRPSKRAELAEHYAKQAEKKGASHDRPKRPFLPTRVVEVAHKDARTRVVLDLPVKSHRATAGQQGDEESQ